MRMCTPFIVYPFVFMISSFFGFHMIFSLYIVSEREGRGYGVGGRERDILRDIITDIYRGRGSGRNKN